MQKRDWQIEVLKALMREAWGQYSTAAERKSHVIMSLHLLIQNARKARQYEVAMWATNLNQQVRTSVSLRQLYTTMVGLATETPASNTGVTETGAAVPEELFTRGKQP